MYHTHLAWDLSILDNLGLPKNKTGKTKTQCEKIVSYKQIVTDNPTCPKCKDWLSDTYTMADLLGIEL